MITIEALQKYRRDTEGVPLKTASYYGGEELTSVSGGRSNDSTVEGGSSVTRMVPVEKFSGKDFLSVAAVAFGAGLLGSLVGFAFARRRL